MIHLFTLLFLAFIATSCEMNGGDMGKGKGAVEGWVAPVLPGRILFEISGCSETIAKEAMSRAANKLCVRCKFLAREN